MTYFLNLCLQVVEFLMIYVKYNFSKYNTDTHKSLVFLFSKQFSFSPILTIKQTEPLINCYILSLSIITFSCLIFYRFVSKCILENYEC